jgi:hypothetical protein
MNRRCLIFSPKKSWCTRSPAPYAVEMMKETVLDAYGRVLNM